MGLICSSNKKSKGRVAAHDIMNQKRGTERKKTFHNEEIVIQTTTTSRENINKIYNFKKVIGAGHFGTVKIATNVHDRG